jgi:hypothetical protein
MDEGKVVCPNCRQLVAPLALDDAAACCPYCRVRVRTAGESVAAQGTPGLPPALNMHGDGRGLPGTSVQAKSNGTEARRQPRGKGAWEIVKIVLGGAAGLGIGYLVVFWIQNRNAADPQPKPRRPQSEQVIARAPSSDKLPEFRPEPSVPLPPIMPSFSAPPIGFGPPERSGVPAPSSAQSAASSAPATNGSSAARSQEPSPSAPQQELEGLPPALKLPSLVDTSSAILCPLHVPAGKTLDIALNAVAANIPAEAALLIERDASAGASWLFSFAPDLSSAAQDKKPLAVLEHAGGKLKFTWRSPIEDAQVRKELANCLLRVTCGTTSKTSVLRVPQEMPRLKVDLERNVSIFPAAPA